MIPIYHFILIGAGLIILFFYFIFIFKMVLKEIKYMKKEKPVHNPQGEGE